MAFWGVEVKPGKPVTHLCEKARGRLRISQATLGISDATKKSIVQCNLGKKSPVLLCVLLPNHTESCHLDLEFEESDDVVFSVIGPRSVYLTGYYVRQSQQPNGQSDSESYGVDIQDTQTEESSYHSDDDDDEYEDSFIDDDEMKEFSPSPVVSSKVNDKLKNGKRRGRRLQKKIQVVESDKDASSPEREDEDGYLLSVFKSKRAAKTTLTASNGKDQMHSPDIANPKKKRKECSKEEDHGVSGENKGHEVEAFKNLRETPEPSSVKKSKKRRKEKLDGSSTEGTGVEFNDVAECDKLEQDLLRADRKKKKLPAADGDKEQQIDNIVSMKSELLPDASQPEKKTKKKTKKKNQVEEEKPSYSHYMALPDMTNNQENRHMTLENQFTNAKATQYRTLSNGLIIEKVANGPPDGKVASHGKKVKIFYTAMLKDDGHIFDSNVGKSAFKFRLGDKEISDGWNLGIEGMHVGDKRRLIVPPTTGSGEHGMGENVPPNSWLVYYVELVGIRK
ncbi:hypothetical protein ACS0TY_003572 [Phlomoides rotata]